MVRIHSHISTLPFAFVAFVAMGMSASVADQVPAGPHNPATPQQVGKLPAPDPVPAVIPFCFGDGTEHACPCSNTGAPGRGCDNSALTGGAILWATGASRLSNDTLQLHVQGELPTSLSILLQGYDAQPATNFGDGVRCVGTNLKRLYAQNAIGGMVSFPGPGAASISARSIELGGAFSQGAVRYYQVYYRDPEARFCDAPYGAAFNVTNGVAVTWVK